jgi:hypothetical protein
MTTTTMKKIPRRVNGLDRRSTALAYVARLSDSVNGGKKSWRPELGKDIPIESSTPVLVATTITGNTRHVSTEMG